MGDVASSFPALSEKPKMSKYQTQCTCLVASLSTHWSFPIVIALWAKYGETYFISRNIGLKLGSTVAITIYLSNIPRFSPCVRAGVRASLCVQTVSLPVTLCLRFCTKCTNKHVLPNGRAPRDNINVDLVN